METYLLIALIVIILIIILFIYFKKNKATNTKSTKNTAIIENNNNIASYADEKVETSKLSANKIETFNYNFNEFALLTEEEKELFFNGYYWGFYFAKHNFFNTVKQDVKSEYLILEQTISLALPTCYLTPINTYQYIQFANAMLQNDATTLNQSVILTLNLRELSIRMENNTTQEALVFKFEEFDHERKTKDITADWLLSSINKREMILYGYLSFINHLKYTIKNSIYKDKKNDTKYQTLIETAYTAIDQYYPPKELTLLDLQLIVTRIYQIENFANVPMEYMIYLLKEYNVNEYSQDTLQRFIDELSKNLANKD